MNDRKCQGSFKLGIIFKFSSNWMGGIIYILNIIKILNLLDDNEKPKITLFYKADLESFVHTIKYPYLTAIEWHYPSIMSGNIKSVFFRKNFFVDKILSHYSIDALFPIHDFPVRTKTNVKLISWWADLQHKYYPEFFTKMQILGRNLRIRLILKNCDNLVVSSKAVSDDFTRFYHLREGMNVSIFHFVSVIDNLNNVSLDHLKLRYQLPYNYFLVSNQFHKHKNHKVVLLALAKLKASGIRKHVAFTGKFPASSDSPYLSELFRIMEENKLHDQVNLLGVISRNDQLQLMKYSQAVIQPSLFEGWSTVIEDAKSLQVPVIASNLNVNFEQLGKDSVFFDPHNPDELASILAHYPDRDLNDIFYDDYSTRTRRAAKELLAALTG